MQRLRAAEHGGQRLNGHARDVVERLLRGGRDARGLGMGAQPHRLRLLRAVALLHEARPHATRGAQLGDLLEKVIVDVEEERQARREAVDVQPARQRRLDVSQTVGQRERQLLHRRRARFADVIARDRHGVEARNVPGRELDHVGDDAHRRLRRADPLFLRDELLEHVVLHRAAEALPGHALLVGNGEVHGERHRRCAVDRHRRRDLAERNVGEEALEVVERGDRDALLAHLAARARMVGVVAHERGHVEGGRESRLPLREQVFEARVRVLGTPEPGEHAHGPQAAAIHRRVDAAREGVRTGLPEALVVGAARDVVRCVEGLERDAGQRLEAHVPLLPLAFATHFSTSRAITSFWICDVPS